jgi:hypothetical protein
VNVTVAFRSDVIPLATILWEPAAPADAPEGMWPEHEKEPVPVAVVLHTVTDGGEARPVL